MAKKAKKSLEAKGILTQKEIGLEEKSEKADVMQRKTDKKIVK
jgi:phage gp16-like protein